MKKFYRLLNHEMSAMLPVLLLLCAALVLTTLQLLRSAVPGVDYKAVYQRYEDVFAASGSVKAAFLFFFVYTVFCVIRLYSSYWGSKSIYTLLTLPASRSGLYAAKLGAFVVGFLLLAASEVISVKLGYSLYADRVANASDGRFVMHDGQFLAWIRSPYFRLLLPESAGGWLASFGVVALWATGLLYVYACERGKRLWGHAVSVAAAYIAFKIVTRLTERGAYELTESDLYRYGAEMLVFSVYFAWYGMRLFRRGALA